MHSFVASLQTNTQTVIHSNDSNKSDGKQIVSDYTDNKSNRNQDSISIGMELSDNKHDNDFDSHRSHIYLTNPILNEDIIAFKSRSLPWNQSNKRRTVSIDDESQEDFHSKVMIEN